MKQKHHSRRKRTTTKSVLRLPVSRIRLDAWVRGCGRVADDPGVIAEWVGSERPTPHPGMPTALGLQSFLGSDLPDDTVATVTLTDPAPWCNAEKIAHPIQYHTALRLSSVTAAGEVVQIGIRPAAVSRG